MKEKLDAVWRVIVRVFWIVLAGICIVAFLTFFTPKYHQYNELNKRIRDMQQNNRALKTAIQRLEMRQRRFVSDSSFVERTARELGMAKPGEIVYKYFPGDFPDH